MPHALAGIRIEPPPSFACAMGTAPTATATAEPPLEPPEVRCGSHGLCVAPCNSGSVVGASPNSGVFVFPSISSPAAL